MAYHSEARADEVFLGNVPAERGARSCFRHIKTLRVGGQAYDLSGKRLPAAYMRPLFIGKQDEAEYGRICMDQMKQGAGQ